jgi:hypothetical protein
MSEVAISRNTAWAALLALAFCAISCAIEPRKSAQDYPAHAESAAADIGVEYQVHSFSSDGQMYFTKDYLVCEVAIYPKGPLPLTGTSFELRMNRSKTALQQSSPEFVAASLKYPDWTQHPQLELGAGVGNAGVTLGSPPAVGRFPGDPSVTRPYPQPPRAPDDQTQENPHKVEKTSKDAAQLALDTALPAGRITGAVAGNIYFPFSGNLKKMKSISLILHTPSGDVEIPLR